MDANLIPQNNHGVMVDDDDDDDLGLIMSSTSSEDDSSSNSLGGSSSSDFAEDATSSESLSSPPASEDRPGDEEGPLYEMSSLMTQLPFKRGLSKFYQGKAQSFASLSNVRCLEDLAKPERPQRKKLKSSRSCGGWLETQRSNPLMGCSRVITKRASRGSFSSSINTRRNNNFLCSRLPTHHHRYRDVETFVAKPFMGRN